MTEVEHWDFLSVYNFGGKTPPAPTLCASDRGCGCCSSSRDTKDLNEAIVIVEQFIEDRKQDVAEWTDWLAKAKEAGGIIE